MSIFSKDIEDMKYLDYLFWHLYCFCERHKRIYFSGIVWQSILMMLISFLAILGSVLVLIEIFIVELPVIDNISPAIRTILIIILICPISEYLNYRYSKKQSIIKNDYQMFRERWGDSLHNSKKNRIIVLCYFLISVVGTVIIAIIIGELNRRGLIDVKPRFS